ncbi:MAG: type IV pilus assembly protein PilM [Syntrophobacterales bacterium]|nr:type IV pilus assembly protein PilM [Syntrophobacterales bacterium]OPX41331.1 MAG: hypothetical protein B1H13_02635 [Desulfobacteraceae bacterium 4484_190.3]
MFEISGVFSDNSKKVVGLDVGSSLIKLVEIGDSRQGYVLKKYGQIPIPRGVIEKGLLQDQTILAEKIRTLFKSSKCRLKNVVAALSGSSVIVKKANFAQMHDEELRELLTDEAENYMPFDDVSEINFDFHIIGENDLNPNQMDVMIVAAKKDIIESYINAIETAGRKVVIMDVDTLAMETAYVENYDFADEDIIGLVNIGASTTDINIVRGGESVFTRSFQLGGDSITEALQKKLKVSFEEAEKVKIEGGGKKNIGKKEILGYTEPIFSEIERSIDYFSSTFMDPYIKQILISGGCSKLPGMINMLSERLHCEVERFDPFRNVVCNSKVFDEAYLEEIGPAATIGIGLALRRIDDKD